MSIARVSRHRTALTTALALVAVLAAAPLAAPLRAQGLPPQLHAPFDSLLRQHVRDGLVDYDAMARAPQFAAYLGTLARTRSDGWPRAERLALLINAYNAYTIAQVNAHNERRSIRNINKSFGVVGSGAWGEKMATIGGVTLTLDEIEHERIRPVFKEPRIHFALVCAARGCPPLRAEAYRGDVLDQQLTDQAQRFLLRSPTKNRVDVAAATVYLSPIFKWYGSDFGKDEGARLRYIGSFFPDGAEARLLATGRARIRWTDYDWSLNILGKAH
ncbi:MAG: DUF547 domain-containing protein [Gemmatimonadetes bacterium]|nr:DUF547 domain-containing protein [Gemmatimonadota bacterium]